MRLVLFCRRHTRLDWSRSWAAAKEESTSGLSSPEVSDRPVTSDGDQDAAAVVVGGFIRQNKKCGREHRKDDPAKRTIPQPIHLGR